MYINKVLWIKKKNIVLFFCDLYDVLNSFFFLCKLGVMVIKLKDKFKSLVILKSFYCKILVFILILILWE